MNHSKEPWSKCGLTILGQDYLQIAVAEAHPSTAMEVQEANACRIVACVNACEGIDTETLEVAPGYKAAIDGFHEQRAKAGALLEQRNELLDMLKRIAPELESYWFRQELIDKTLALIAEMEGTP